MSVELPPPVTPQQGTVEQLQSQAGGGVVVAFQTYQMHVNAGNVLDAAAIQNAVSLADNLSNAVRNIGAAAYLAGYPAAQVTYALSGQDLYVLVLPGKISGIRASERLKPYLNGLEKADPMRDSDLEGHRTLASMAADRASVTVFPVFEPDGNGGQVLDFEKNNQNSDPTTVRAEFGNPGNRFASRYFLDMEVKTASVWGDEFRVFAREGIQNLDAGDKPGDYHEQNVGWNRVTPWGVFGAGGRFINYNYTATSVTPNVNILGRVWIGEALWLYPLYSDFNSRWTVQLKADRTSKSGKIDSTATTGSSEYQRELYTSAEIATSYGDNFQFLTRRWNFTGGASVRKGFGDHNTNYDTANPPIHGDLGYLLFRPAVTLKVFLTDNISTGVELSGQYSKDSVPEQQQWVLGGLGNLTSSLPGVAVGDKGYLARAYGEIALPLTKGLELRPKVFVERGVAKFAIPTTANQQINGNQSLTDAGLELGVKFTQLIDGTLAYAKSFNDKNIPQSTKDGSNARLYFRVSIKI
jgi:hemolysin activation/secretion protein